MQSGNKTRHNHATSLKQVTDRRLQIGFAKFHQLTIIDSLHRPKKKKNTVVYQALRPIHFGSSAILRRSDHHVMSKTKPEFSKL